MEISLLAGRVTFHVCEKEEKPPVLIMLSQSLFSGSDLHNIQGVKCVACVCVCVVFDGNNLHSYSTWISLKLNMDVD